MHWGVGQAKVVRTCMFKVKSCLRLVTDEFPNESRHIRQCRQLNPPPVNSGPTARHVVAVDPREPARKRGIAWGRKTLKPTNGMNSLGVRALKIRFAPRPESKQAAAGSWRGAAVLI